MRNLILMEHISLDGFVAGTKGEFDGFEASEENLRFVCEIAQQADATLMGRKTFVMLDEYWPTKKDQPGASQGEIAYSKWYNSARKIAISRTMQPNGDRTVIGENLEKEILKIKQGPGKDILVFGSPSIAQILLDLSLVDSAWIFVNPVLFGEGIPLFKKMAKKTKLRVLNTRQFANGELGIHYAFEKNFPTSIKSTY